MIRVLLDEDLDVRFRLEFGSDFDVETVEYCGWKGKRNGELLTLAEGDFDVLVSADSNLLFQQNVARFDLGVIVMRLRSKALPYLVEALPDLIRAIKTVEPGKLLEVGPLAQDRG